MAVTAGRDGKTAVKMVPPSRPPDNFPDCRYIPSRPAYKISPVKVWPPADITCLFLYETHSFVVVCSHPFPPRFTKL